MAGLTSLPKKKNIKGQPHKLAYITEDESDLLKSRGGAGKPVQGTKGVPAFYSDPGDAGDMGGPDTDAAESAGGDSEGSMGFSAASFDAAQQAADDQSAADDFDAMSGGDQSDPSVGSVDPGDTFGGFFDPGTPEFSGFGMPDIPTTPQGVVDALTNLAQRDKERAQSILDAREFSPNLLGTRQMNALEEQNLKTFGLGYRGASFAKANPNLTTVEAVAQHNAESPTLSISINDVQSMGFDLNAPVGPQADFREAVAQRGVAQGIGLMAAGPMTGLATIATDGKGVMGLVAEELGIKDKLDKLDVLPSYQDLALDVFGPSKDTMQPGSFGISPTTADLSTPTDSQIGYTDMGLGSFAPDGNEFSQLPISIQTQTAPVQEVQVAEKDAPRFPVRDTTPDSVIRTLGQIYKDAEGNPDEKRARELLGIGIA